MITTKFHHGWTTLCLLVLACLSSAPVLAQDQPPTPVFTFQFRTTGTPQPARFQLVQNILQFEPGAATPFHQHPGQVLVTVLEGENTFTQNGVETLYTTGESFVELPGEVNQARNDGATPMSVMATYLLPLAAPLSQPEPNDTTPPPRPVVGAEFKTEAEPISGAFDVAQAVLDFAPGAATPFHTHPGPVSVTVVDGELTFTLNGVERVYRAGESFVEPPEQVAQARNASAQSTRVLASYLLPPGAPLSTPHVAPLAPAPLPRTGQDVAGIVRGSLMALATLGLLGGAWIRRRRPEQPAR